MRWIILIVMVGVSWHPKPVTTAELINKARQKSISKICDKPRKTKAVKELCRKWEK